MKLYTYPALFRSQKVLIAAQYAKQDVEVRLFFSFSLRVRRGRRNRFYERVP